MSATTETHPVIAEMNSIILERDSLKKKLQEMFLQHTKELQQEKDKRTEMESDYKAKINELHQRNITQEDRHLESENRILDIAEKMACSSTAMGGPVTTPRSDDDSDPVCRLEAELNQFCRQFTVQETSILDAMARFTSNLRVVADLEVKTRCKNSSREITAPPPPSQTDAPQESPQMPSPPESVNENPEEGLAETVVGGAMPPKKRRRHSPPAQLEQTIKIEPTAVFNGQHKRNGSIEYRGKHACACRTVFKDAGGLRKHINYYHPTEKKNASFRCPIPDINTPEMQCEHVFQSSRLLTEHARIYHGVNVTFRQCGINSCREVIPWVNEERARHYHDEHFMDLTVGDDGEGYGNGESTNDTGMETTAENGQDENEESTGITGMENRTDDEDIDPVN